MNDYRYDVNTLIKRYPELESCRDSINSAYETLLATFKSGHKLLIAGNGGSCADADHIAGELMKKFKKDRPISNEFKEKLQRIDFEKGNLLADKLQAGLPCIALHNHQGLNTAFINDVPDGGEFTYAQQLNVYGNKGDTFLGITTSGNSKNVIYAAITAKAKGMKVIALTGKDGGKIKDIADISIIVNNDETFMIQELHLPIYHCLCLMLEEELF